MSRKDMLLQLLDGQGGMALLTGIPMPVRIDDAVDAAAGARAGSLRAEQVGTQVIAFHHGDDRSIRGQLV